MNTKNRTEHVVRERILNLLSDAEIATVATDETRARLLDGDEYLDLEHLSDGVLRAPDQVRPIGRVLPRRSVQDATWQEILSVLTGAG
jgi:hypothetical protein